MMDSQKQFVMAVATPERNSISPIQTQAAARCTGLGYLSSAIFATVLFFTANGVASSFMQRDPFASANKSWIWWAVRDLCQSPPPQIAILGSSLMLAAVNDGDATYLHTQLDAVLHHRSVFFESLLTNRRALPVRTASLAVGGQMASDVYAICAALFSNAAYKPKAVIWGIAPRDFIDSTFTDVQSSEIVRYLGRVARSDLLGEKRSIWSTFDAKLEDSLYLYGNRVQFLSQTIAGVSMPLGSLMPPQEAATAQALRKIITRAGVDDNLPGQWLVAPYAPNVSFSDNTAEYKQRYRPFKPWLFNKQLGYLEKSLQFCRRHGVRMILVNMPLTNANLCLIPDGVYAQYSSRVQELAVAYDAEFVDFNQNGCFTPSEFADTVHLNGLGGMKFWRLLADRNWLWLTQ